MIRALAVTRDEGLDWRACFVRWGRDVAASEALLAELGLGDRIEWIDPIRKRQLWSRYLASHAVLDQFMAPAIGGVTFEAMALGRRVITALDVPTAAAFFGAEPPLYAAWSIEEIAGAIRRVVLDPDDDHGLGQAAQEWFRRQHSAERIVQLQVDAYRRVLEEPPASPEPIRDT